MKKLFVMLAAFASLFTYAQEQAARDDIKKFQDELNKEYKDPEQSPLEPKDRKRFKAHEFFPIDLKFRVTARLDRDLNSDVFQMKTSTDRLANYRRYATAIFEIDSVEYRLTIYQSIDLLKNPEYKDYLFLPFTDKTTGNQTYGGGRYLDMRISEGNEITIDFNKAYNPYCAYSTRYSCPKVPGENNLPIAITAGIKLSAKH